MSTIIRLNDAMLAFHDTQLSVTSGVLIFGKYQFKAAKKDTRDITIKIPNIGYLRLISWIRSHPKKDEGAHNPDEMAKGIFMVDVVSVLEQETIKTLGNTRLSMVQVETLELKKHNDLIILMF
jgi:hypothetical protein